MTITPIYEQIHTTSFIHLSSNPGRNRHLLSVTNCVKSGKSRKKGGEALVACTDGMALILDKSWALQKKKTQNEKEKGRIKEGHPTYSITSMHTK